MRQSETPNALVAKPIVDLLNKVDPPARVMFHCVPTRIIRVIAIDESFKSFRVEQLIMTGGNRSDPKGTWRTLSTHGGPVAGEAYGIASKAAIVAQNELRKKLQARVGKSTILRP